MMQFDTYITRYICPKCKHISSTSHQGPKSNIAGMLKYILKYVFCTKCASTKGSTIMDILDVTCKTRLSTARGRYVTWECGKCSVKWSTYEHLKDGDTIKDLYKNHNQSCINSSCSNKSECIRMVRVRVI